MAWLGTEPIEINLDGYGAEKYDVVDNGASYNDFILKVDVTWNSSSGLAGCGVVFRSDSDISKGENYQFITIRLSGLPIWAIQYWNFGSIQRTEWTSTSALIDQKQDSTNTYVIVARSETVYLYANSGRLGVVTANKHMKGQIAFQAFQESGQTTCTFSNAWIWSLPK